MADERLKIGDLARLSDTKVVTVRYYEKIGLLPEPLREESNYRSYGEETLRRLRFIRRARGLGFSLEQVRDLLDLAAEERRPCEEVDRITSAHLADVERKIADLTALAAELRRLSSSCKGDRTIADCRILHSIAPD